MSGSQGSKTWIRIFQISETRTEQSYTLYQVTCTTFPLNCPEEAHTVTNWKRFSQFQQLYKQLALVHKQLYLHGQFPELLPAQYFNRKDPEVIEQRRVWSLALLEFLASQPILNTHPVFTSFLFDSGPVIGGTTQADSQPLGGSGEVRRTANSPDLEISTSLSIDTTPVLTPETNMEHSDASPDEARDDAAVSEQNLVSLVSGMSELETEEAGSVLPDYIKAAAEHISSALRHEAEDEIEQSLAAYRAAIGGLLTNVQSDPEPARQAQVKRRIAQYISKAEQLVKREAELKKRKVQNKPQGIPHLQLFGQLSELKNFKVKNILGNKLILAENIKNQELVIFKTLHKSPAVYKKSKTSLLPINISYMVRLLKYFETDDCVYLMLEYCSAGTLWNIVQPLICQKTINRPETSKQISDERIKSPVQKQTSIIKPSESFIHDRKISINLMKDDPQPTCDFSNSDNEDDLMIVHKTNSNAVVVVNANKIEHFENMDEQPDSDDSGLRLKCDSNLVKSSQSMIDQISEKLGKNDEGVKNVLDKLDHLESKIKRHMEGDLSPDQDIATETLAKNVDLQQECAEVPPETEVSAPSRPAVLRKLSEILPQCCNIIEAECGDMTEVPDKLIRAWAAQLAQVLSSLHYREVVIRDLHPANLLLDDIGQVKLTYQCKWVSVESSLAPEALAGHYCAPEVLTFGDVTPAADWFSFGAILHLLYSGVPVPSVLASGLDSSLPLQLPLQLPAEVTQFIAALLQPHPEARLGAGSCGSHDVRSHPYFSGWNWSKMSWN